uniref:Uncharacterized protein n=1 Tax=Myoviridae sp. ctwmI4 TaxID=2826710 RepID=A0A8S5LU58_9CAUD|nr:MAG TPA: hypothetical protein [Myoviridae sp. ctwmI4]
MQPHAAHSQLEHLNDNTSIKPYVLRIFLNKTFV